MLELTVVSFSHVPGCCERIRWQSTGAIRRMILYPSAGFAAETRSKSSRLIS